MSEIICAFCRGRGLDPFGLLSPLARCQVCGGKGMVFVQEPVIKCAFCQGRGRYPYGVRITCTVCMGKGVVTVKEPTITCIRCRGNGRAPESGLSCLPCRGKGTFGITEMGVGS